MPTTDIPCSWRSRVGPDRCSPARDEGSAGGHCHRGAAVAPNCVGKSIGAAGWEMAKITGEAANTKASHGALAGVKIVDLTRVLGGPFGTQLLADHGADVIKIEPPMGDEVRDWGPPFHDDDASYYIGIKRNKR